jgi:subtilisin family serine protease
MKTNLNLSVLATAVLLSASAQAQTLQSWMSPEVKQAWDMGYKGQRVTIQVIDDFTSSSRFSGNLGTGTLYQRHGEWTRLEARMVAPSAKMVSVDFNNPRAVRLARGLNVLNLSYGMFAVDGYSTSQILWGNPEKSIISYAQRGSAIVAKAAGNDAVAVGAANRQGDVDYLNRALIGTQTTIFVGALSKNGTTSAPASLAPYSNYAGSDAAVQQNFLVVGVEGSKTGLYGTSFAAPIVSGYAAILGSKFRKAKPTQITNQLLNTARTDTIANYSAAVHGRGEASIHRALAPVSIK